MKLESLDVILPRLVDDGLPDGGEFLLADLDVSERTSLLICLLIWHGYLPMAGMGMLLPKIHKERCILPPRDVHVGKKVRKRAKGFHLSVNQAWSAVVSNIQKLTYTHSKGDCWLTDEIAAAYEAAGRTDSVWSRAGSIRFHSVELWHTASGELVAGEIGYTCGRVYSSCTGFTRKEEYPGTGNVQLAALARWLARCGFELWDLGMKLDYKLELGGYMVSRSKWADKIRELRSAAAELAAPKGEEAKRTGLATEASSCREQCVGTFSNATGA
eukprot:CAMPEP_0171290932 /NCGR_PEP_ID=MMETSP0790-20130122/71397_1 /TAXON_ID=2925 /ORGANISM="Alexandrium catenella, Strain OF101" /LENGTH=271 /DNA_ID=CAMNT_0011760651 /DNA_START=72 /DNA_END=888 /DNA_ORIENTATION=+